MEAAFFDLDKTVISRASVFALVPHFYRAGLLTRRTIIESVYRQLLYSLFGADEKTMERARQGMLELTRGWEAEGVTRIIADTVEDSISPIVFAGALELINEHKRAGRLVYIVSSSPEEIVRPLASFLGVDEVIATRAQVIDGRYTGLLEFYSYGPYKAEAMERLAVEHDIDLKASYAYSDSITDLPMLEAVGHPVAVNADRALRRVAVERHWEVVDFRRQVRLRQRVPTPPAQVIVPVVIGGAAVTAAVLWYRSRHQEVPGLERLLVRLRLIKPRPTGIAAVPERARAAAQVVRTTGATALESGRHLAARARGQALAQRLSRTGGP